MGNSVPDPVNSVRTRGNNDPIAFGAYSAAPPRSEMDDYDALGAPVNNWLFFADETTTSLYPATVHGAFITGERDADRILAFLRG